MITSNQVNQMMMMQQQQHMMMSQGAGMMGGAMPNPGMSQYPPQFSWRQSGNPNQAMSGRAWQGGMGAAGSMLGMGASASGMIGLGVAGAGMAGIGVGAGLAAAGSLPVMAGLGGMAWMAGQAQQGGQQLGQVGQIFGNQMYGNSQGRHGRGMATGDMLNMYKSMRKAESGDMFTNMGDMMQIGNVHQQMGMGQGVQNIEKLTTMVTDFKNTLVKMAKRMGTTIQEASGAFGQMRQAGFYTSSDVMGNTSEMNVMRGYGMTSSQFGGMQAGAAGQARGMGMSGQTGARYVTGMASDLMGAVTAGTMSGDRLMDITGATTPTEAAGAFASKTMGGMANFMLNQAGGNAMLLGLGEFKGGKFGRGMDQNMLQGIQRGGVTMRDLARKGSERTRTGAGAASFLANKEDIAESILSNPEGATAIVNLIKNTMKEEGKHGEEVAELMFKQLTGSDRKTYRVLKDMADRHATTRQRRLATLRRDNAASEFGTEIRENRSMGGLWQKTKEGIREHTTGPLQAGFATMKSEFMENTERFMDRAYGVERLSASGSQLESGMQGLLAMNLMGEDTAALTGGQRAALSSQGIDVDSMTEAGVATGGNAATSYARMGDVRRMQKALGGAGKVKSVSSGAKAELSTLASQLHHAEGSGKQKGILNQMRKRVRAEHSGTMISDDEADAIIAKSGDGAAHAVKKVRSKGGATGGWFGDNREGGTPAAVARESLTAMAAGLTAEGTGMGGTDMSTVAAATAVGVLGGAAAGAAIGAVAGSFIPVAGNVAGFFVGMGVGAIAGAWGGVMGGAAAGGGAYLLGLGESEFEQFGEDLAAGTGVELMSKLNDPGALDEFDKVMKMAIQEDFDSPQERNAFVAKKLSQRMGITISSADVKIAEGLLTQATGKPADLRNSRDRRKAKGITGKVAKIQGKLVAGKTRKAFQEFSTAAMQGLGAKFQGKLDKSLQKMSAQGASGDDVFDALRESIRNAADAGISTSTLGANASDEARLLAGGAMTLRELERAGEEGGLTLEEIAGIAGGSTDEWQALFRDQGISTAGGKIRESDKKRVSELIATASTGGIISQGAAGIGSFVNAGQTDLEKQTKSVEKLASMVDAMFARATGQDPTTPDGTRIHSTTSWTKPEE